MCRRGEIRVISDDGWDESEPISVITLHLLTIIMTTCRHVLSARTERFILALSKTALGDSRTVLRVGASSILAFPVKCILN